MRRGDAGDDDGGGDGQQQRRDLGDETVADGQKHIGFRRSADTQTMLQGADEDAADDVDDEDQDPGHGIALDEFPRTIHRAVEIGLGRHFGAAGAGFVGCQKSGVQVGVDGHLLARHGIEGEAGRHFRHATRALGDHHQVDDHEDDEDQQADDEIARDDEFPERLDHLAGGIVAGMAFGENDAGRGHVERQAEDGGDQQEAGKAGEIERAIAVERDHQDHEREQDIAHEEDVEKEDGQRQHHHRDDREDAQRQGKAPHGGGGTRSGGDGGHGRDPVELARCAMVMFPSSGLASWAFGGVRAKAVPDGAEGAGKAAVGAAIARDAKRAGGWHGDCTEGRDRCLP